MSLRTTCRWFFSVDRLTPQSARRTSPIRMYSRTLHVELLEDRRMLAGTVMAEITSYPTQVTPTQSADVTVRVKFTGDDNDGPWRVTDLDLRDDDDGNPSNNADPLNIYQNIVQVNDPFDIINQGVWYS